jgi:hypothetical protein
MYAPRGEKCDKPEKFSRTDKDAEEASSSQTFFRIASHSFWNPIRKGHRVLGKGALVGVEEDD